jgi:hypothetical protein
MDKEVRKLLNRILDYQITLGAEALFDGVFSGPNPEQQSFHHLLNRVMMMAQVPITFIVYRNPGDGSPYEQTYIANRHPRHREKIEIKYKDAHQYLTHMIPLWGVSSNHYILVLKADSYSFPELPRIEHIHLVDDAWSAAAYKIGKIFGAEQYDVYGPNFLRYLVESINRVEAPESSKRLPPMPMDKIAKQKFDRWILESATRWEVRGRGLIDRIFSKIEKNIISIANNEHNKQGRLTNFILFSRDYDARVNDGNIVDNKRYSDYDYNLRILLGSRQRQEIENHLRGWRESSIKDERERRYKNQLVKVSNVSAKSLAIQVSDWFWELIQNDTMENRDLQGVNFLIDNLGAYFGPNARSMADPVFDGVSFFREPFANDGGMGRCFHKEPGNVTEVIPSELSHVDDVRKRDLLRIVTCQYLFESMATSAGNVEDGNHLQIMLNPLEVGGRVWGVVGYVTRSQGHEQKFMMDKQIWNYHHYWLQNYHVYGNVNERMKKNLRTHMNRFYESSVADVYNEWAMSKYKEYEQYLQAEASTERVKRPVPPNVSELKARMRELSCVFPYDVIELEPRLYPNDEWPTPLSEDVLGSGVDAPPEARTAPLALGLGVIVSAVPESCFPDAPGGRTGFFVDAVDVAVTMTDGITREVVKQGQKVAQDVAGVTEKMKNPR